jgi:hypothetical protein
MTSPCLQERVKSRLTHTDIFTELRCWGSVRHGKDYIRFTVDFVKELMGIANCGANGFAEM